MVTIRPADDYLTGDGDNSGADTSIDVTLDERQLKPAVLETETSGSGEVATYTDQCGRQEADQLSSGNAQHTIEALLYKDVLQEIYQLYANGEKVDLTLPAEIDTVGVFVTDVTIKQDREIKEFFGIENPTDRDVFQVQIQLKTQGAIDEEEQ